MDLQKQSLLVLVLLFFTESALSWGNTGHRVVGEVAAHYLTPKAKKKVDEILQGEELADSTTWADYVKSNPAWDDYRSWHYVSIPDGSSFFKSKKSKHGDVVRGLKEMIKRLKSKKTSLKEKRAALRFFTHFVGDLHQPLHAGRKGDRGGNDIKVLWFGKQTNLHVVWDSSMIDHEKLSFSELARFINKPKKEDKKWLKDPIETWAKESVNFRPQVYEFSSIYISPEKLKDLKMQPEGTKAEKVIPTLSWQYHARNWPLVKRRLYQAGRRLAYQLNETFK